jgi:phage shock protein E
MGLFSAIFSKPDNRALPAMIKDGAFLVDVRTPAEFLQGSVKGAVNIPLSSIPRQIEKFRGKKNIIVFCRSGNRSEAAKNMLEQNGLHNVINGGNWQNVEFSRTKINA